MKQGGRCRVLCGAPTSLNLGIQFKLAGTPAFPCGTKVTAKYVTLVRNLRGYPRAMWKSWAIVIGESRLFQPRSDSSRRDFPGKDKAMGGACVGQERYYLSLVRTRFLGSTGARTRCNHDPVANPNRHSLFDIPL